MDPNACFSDLLDAVACGEVSDARDAAENLTEWLRKGGFYPGNGMLRESAIDAFLRWILRWEED